MTEILNYGEEKYNLLVEKLNLWYLGLVKFGKVKNVL